MGKCFLCENPLKQFEGAIASIDKGEHRQKGGKRVDGVHICLGCAETNPQVIKYKTINLSDWKYPQGKPRSQIQIPSVAKLVGLDDIEVGK